MDIEDIGCSGEADDNARDGGADDSRAAKGKLVEWHRPRNAFSTDNVVKERLAHRLAYGVGHPPDDSVGVEVPDLRESAAHQHGEG